MTIFSTRYTAAPASSLPVFFSPFAPAESEINDQALIVGATPQSVSELGIPAVISVVDGGDMRLVTPRINLSESLTSVPGLQVQNRQSCAQDLQLSIRGFSSRTACSIRGIRSYVDDISAIVPDGRDQTSSINIGSVQNIEVLYDLSSTLYGSASSGVMNVSTETGHEPPTVEADSFYGSFGT